MHEVSSISRLLWEGRAATIEHVFIGRGLKAKITAATLAEQACHVMGVLCSHEMALHLEGRRTHRRALVAILGHRLAQHLRLPRVRATGCGAGPRSLTAGLL